MLAFMATPRGPEAFEAWYAAALGERWPRLRAALLAGAPGFSWGETAGLIQPYRFDEASFWCAQALGVEPQDRVLDLCAAPGGKTLVLAAALAGRGRLDANEPRPERRRRLKTVLDTHLPPAWRQTVEVHARDGTRWALGQSGRWNKILVDAPCSSEQHLLEQPRYLAEWSPRRSRSLALQQYALLNAAFTVLEPGGLLVYSTCALSEAENDGVIAKLAQRHPGEWTLERPALPSGEATAYGWQIWPDLCAGRGPIYLARLRRSL